MIEIPVALGPRRYDVLVGAGALARLRALTADVGRGRVVVVSTPRVWRLHGARVARALGSRAALPVLVPDGERHKTRATLDRVHDGFLRARLARDGLVVVVGGGVVGDLAGFAAATYMRGVDWIPVPTTLLAMVDSSIGGKVGINHPRAKNLIGAFHQPRAVVVDPSFLETLPPREVRGGAYEILKCGIIGDAKLFAAFDAAGPGVVTSGQVRDSSIAAAVRLKAEVVGSDEKEAGLRRVLNLGHTLGHAFEAVTRYRRFTHGEAVGWGLIGEAALARDLGRLDPAVFERIAAAVDRIGPRPSVADLRSGEVLEAVGRDKKARGGRVPFVLPVDIGRVIVEPHVAPAAIRRVLSELAGWPARRRG